MPDVDLSHRLPAHRTRSAVIAALAAVVAFTAACGGSGGSGSDDTAARGGSGSSAAAPSSPSSSSSSSSSQSGGDSADTDAVVAKAKAALLAAKSVQVSGVVVQDSAQTSLDLGYAANGTSGSVTTQGFKFSVIVIAKTVYFKAPDAFWKKQAGANAAKVLALVSGKWIKAPSTDANFGQFAKIADKSQFASQLFDEESGDLKVGDDKTVLGVECQAIESDDGTLYVAKDDGRPVQIASNGKSGEGAVNFTKYNQVANTSPPPAAQTVDLSQLGG